MNHYVYLTCDSSDGRLYWGSRSCDDDPKDDSYMGSHKDTTYNPDLKWVWATFETRLEADDAEDILHDLFDAVESETFANLSKRTFRHWEWVGSRHTPETREKLRANMLGENNHRYGKPGSDKQKEAVRKAATGRKDSKETTRRKQKAQQQNGAENKKGKSLYHNSETQEQHFFSPESVPDGWIKGFNLVTKERRFKRQSKKDHFH